MSQPAPGWYPDPAGSQRLRWWNGGAWTEQFRDLPQENGSTAQQPASTHDRAMNHGVGSGVHMPTQTQAPTVSADPYNPSGSAPELGLDKRESSGGGQTSSATPRTGRGWFISSIISAVVALALFVALAFAGLQLHAKNLELREAESQKSSAEADLGINQRNLDQAKKELEEAQK